MLKTVEDFENRSRKNNLIVHGLEENDKGTPASLQNTIRKELFEERLEVEINSVERCHKLGEIDKEQSRPVIMKFQDHRAKATVQTTGMLKAERNRCLCSRRLFQPNL